MVYIYKHFISQLLVFTEKNGPDQAPKHTPPFLNHYGILMEKINIFGKLNLSNKMWGMQIDDLFQILKKREALLWVNKFSFCSLPCQCIYKKYTFFFLNFLLSYIIIASIHSNARSPCEQKLLLQHSVIMPAFRADSPGQIPGQGR